MGHTEIAPEAITPSQNPPNINDEKQIAQCIRYIKLLSCVLITTAALCIVIIGVLSWHIIRSVSYHDDFVTQNEFNTETAKAKMESNNNAQESAVNLASETCSNDIAQLQMEVKIQWETIIDLETKLQVHATQLATQGFNLKSYDERLQILNETVAELDNYRQLSDDAQKYLEDILMLKVISENSSSDIINLSSKVNNQEQRIRDLEVKINEHDTQFIVVNETLTNVQIDDIWELKVVAEKNSEEILSLKLVSENSSADITTLTAVVENQMKTTTDLKTKLQALDTVLGSQQFALKTNTEMMQTFNETMTELHINDFRKLEHDAEKRLEDIMRLKTVSENVSADITGLQATVENQEETIRNLESMAKEPSGVGGTYIRWGRAECPGNGSEIVYSGYIGGSYYDHPGAASNDLCLPNEPQYDKYVSDFQTEARIYGAEYHVQNSETFFGRELQYHVPLCAVCKSPRNSVVMIPARTTCYNGWDKEFGGYLVSGFFNQKAASEYICMDNDATFPEWSDAGTQYGKLLYVVEGNCEHNLKCPPYENGKELTCVVCSK